MGLPACARNIWPVFQDTKVRKVHTKVHEGQLKKRLPLPQLLKNPSCTFMCTSCNFVS